MSSTPNTPKGFLPRESTPEKLLFYPKTVALVDITYYVINHYLDVKDRTRDQMLQAARSAKQNIIEGAADGLTSSKMELSLTNCAKGSLRELQGDYEDYLRVHQLERWGLQHPKYQACIPLFQKHNDSEWYRRQIEGRSDEDIANIAIIVIHQTLALLRGLIDRIDRKFFEEGGVKEQRFQARLKYRNNQRVIKDNREIRDLREIPNSPNNPNNHP